MEIHHLDISALALRKCRTLLWYLHCPLTWPYNELIKRNQDHICMISFQYPLDSESLYFIEVGEKYYFIYTSTDRYPIKYEESHAI